MTSLTTLQTYFSSSALPSELRPKDGILIYPSSDNWNDFGHRTLFVFEVLGQEASKPRAFRLAFLGGETTRQFGVLSSVLKEKGVELAPASEFPQFFSLQFGMDEYRKLVEEHGIEAAKAILLGLNDLVAVRRNLPAPNWVEEATKSEAFTHSLIRNSDSFFAYYNAGSVLSGLSNEDLHAVSPGFKLKFQLAGFTSEHQFEFRFDTRSLVPKRMAVLIGKNGVGKSQTLNHIVQAALDGSNSLTDLEGKRPLISRLIAVSTPGETETTFPRAPTKDTRINYLRVSAAPRERADTTGGQTLPEVILQLARHRGNIGEEDRWSIFREAVSRILPFQALRIIPPTQPDSRIQPPLMAPLSAVDIEDLRFGGEQKCLDTARRLDFSGQLVRQIGFQYVPLSSGQLSFVRLAAQLCLHIDNGSLLLIDEPETHLHPNLVTDLVAMLNRILELSGSIAIVATHSAYLVREVPGSQVHVIREDGNRSIEVVQPRLKTFGAEVGAISSFIFGDDIVNRLVEEVESRLKRSPQQYANWKEQLKGELSTEAEMYLSREIGKPGSNAK